MNKIIEDYKKIVAGNEAGKNICFMSRGEYADPKIAYNGILMNYWDVYYWLLDVTGSRIAR